MISFFVLVYISQTFYYSQHTKTMRILIPLILTLLILGCSQKSAECTYSNVEVYFYYSHMCPHCKNVMPYIDELKEKYKDVKFYYCNVSNLSKECYTYSYYVIGVPTVVVHSGDVTTSLVGERDVMGLESLISSLACCGR